MGFQSLIPVLKGKNEAESCRSCAQQNIKRLKAHLNNSKKDCSRMYDLDLLNKEAKALQQKKNREKVAKHREEMTSNEKATFLAKDIFVTTQQNNTIWRHINSHAGTRGTPITLANNQSAEKDSNGRFKNGGEHFQSLIPVLKGKNEAESCRSCAQQNIK